MAVATARIGRTRAHHRRRTSISARGVGLDRLLLVGVALAAAAIVFARRPDAFVHPQFWAEDGTWFFGDAYRGGGVNQLLHQHSSYLELYIRIVALIALHLPLSWAPAVFNTGGLLVQVLPAVLLVSRRSEVLIQRQWVRILVAAFYVLLPNSFEIDVNLTNSQWHLALAAALVLATRPAATRRALVFDSAVVLLGGLTGPFGLMLPFEAAAVAAARRTRRSVTLLVISTLTGVAQLVCVVHSVRTSAEPLGPSVRAFVRIVGGQVVLGPIIGGHGYARLLRTPHGDLVFGAAVVGAAALLGLVAWKGGAAHRALALFALLITASFLLRPASATGLSAWNDLTTPQDGTRYFFIPMVVEVILLAAMAERFRRALLVPAIALAVTSIGVGIRLDFHYPPYRNFHYAAAAARFAHLRPGAVETFDINPPGWTMVLAKR